MSFSFVPLRQLNLYSKQCRIAKSCEPELHFAQKSTVLILLTGKLSNIGFSIFNDKKKASLIHKAIPSFSWTSDKLTFLRQSCFLPLFPIPCFLFLYTFEAMKISLFSMLNSLHLFQLFHKHVVQDHSLAWSASYLFSIIKRFCDPNIVL